MEVGQTHCQHVLVSSELATRWKVEHAPIPVLDCDDPGVSLKRNTMGTFVTIGPMDMRALPTILDQLIKNLD